VQEEARVTAEGEEKNAWQANGAIDRVILVSLLATFVLAVAAAFARAAGRGARVALPASALPGLAAAVTALLVTYRILQEPGFDESTTVKLGPSLALIVLGVLALASAHSLRTQDAAEYEEPSKEAVA
jgi:drug/metabolite transporter (DMT)-like permease